MWLVQKLLGFKVSIKKSYDDMGKVIVSMDENFQKFFMLDSDSS